MDKIRVKEISLYRAEGPRELRGDQGTFRTFAEADQILGRNALTAPKGGAYDKHDFKVVFEDGEIYEGRIDIHHPSYDGGNETLKDHIVEFCRFHGGLYEARELPIHISPADYRAVLARETPEELAAFRKFLETYGVAEAM